MRKHCKVQTYDKVILPEGACNIEKEEEQNPNPYHKTLIIGDLNMLFLGKEEILDKDIKYARDDAYRNLNDDCYDDYGEEYGEQNWRGEEEYGGEGEEGME